MTEPSFVVPLSALVDIGPEVPHEWACWEWRCRIYPESGDGFPSRAEAESAAITHLAEVHGLTVTELEAAGTEARRQGNG